MSVLWFIVGLILAVIAALTGIAAITDVLNREWVEALLHGLICLISIWGLSYCFAALR